MAKNKLRKPKKAAISAKKQVKKHHIIELTKVNDDIEKLLFADFLRCLLNGNLSVLRISGEPSGQQLFMAWIKILSAYYTLIGSKEQLKYLRIVGKMEALNLKITVVKALCEALKAWYDEKIIACLKVWGYKLQYTDQTVLADIERTLVELSNDEYKLIKMQADYELEQKVKKKRGEAPSKNTYMKMLYAIEKHRDHRYPPDKITLYEFGMWCNELIEYNEAIKAQNDKLTEKKYRDRGTK